MRKLKIFFPLCFVLILIIIGFLNGAIPYYDSDPYWFPPRSTKAQNLIKFKDIANSLGINKKLNSLSPHGTFPFKINVSAAATDLNNDGLVDIIFNDNFSDELIYIYTQNKNSSFSKLKSENFLRINSPFSPIDYPNKAGTFDFDNDGLQDILIVGFPHVMLFKNLGNLKFINVSQKLGLDKLKGSFVGFNIFDFDQDGREDILLLSLAIYKNFKNDDHNLILLNKALGFKDVTETFFYKIFKDYTWSSIMGFYGSKNNHSLPDIYIQNDYTESRLFRFKKNLKKYLSIHKALPPSQAHGEMGGDTADLFNKNETNLFSANLVKIAYDRGFNYFFQPNNEKKKFENVANQYQIDNCGFSWGAKFFDANNDGQLELFVGNGGFNYGAQPIWFKYLTWLTIPHFLRFNADSNFITKNSYLATNQKACFFMKNEKGTFDDISKSANLDSLKDSRGLAVLDINKDGLLDLIVANFNEAPNVYLNLSPKGNWVGLKITRKDHLGINGTIVKLHTNKNIYKREIFLHNGLASQNENIVHFGLNKETIIKAEIIFFNSKTKELNNLKENQYNLIYE